MNDFTSKGKTLLEDYLVWCRLHPSYFCDVSPREETHSNHLRWLVEGIMYSGQVIRRQVGMISQANGQIWHFKQIQRNEGCPKKLANIYTCGNWLRKNCTPLAGIYTWWSNSFIVLVHAFQLKIQFGVFKDFRDNEGWFLSHTYSYTCGDVFAKSFIFRKAFLRCFFFDRNCIYCSQKQSVNSKICIFSRFKADFFGVLVAFLCVMRWALFKGILGNKKGNVKTPKWCISRLKQMILVAVLLVGNQSWSIIFILPGRLNLGNCPSNLQAARILKWGCIWDMSNMDF